MSSNQQATSIASYLSAQAGVAAVAVWPPGLAAAQCLPEYASPGDVATMSKAIEIANVRHEPIRVVTGTHTVNVVHEDGIHVAVMTETGHPIAKSLLRMIRRVVRSSAKGKLAA